MKKYSMSKVDPRILLEGVQALMNGLYCSSGLIAGTMERKDLASTVDNWEYWGILELEASGNVNGAGNALLIPTSRQQQYNDEP